MIQFINEHLVPVWVNIRNHSVPEVPALDDDAWDLALRDDRTIASPFYRYYLVRIYVISGDLQRLLNADAGRLGYIEWDPDPYLRMLRGAVSPPSRSPDR